jgi:uncharacterized YigZ family protein
MDVLIQPVSDSCIVKGSRFLAELQVCPSQAEARSLIKSQKGRYQDASHVVHAFVVGSGAEITGMSDDGEPSGTAGRPVLDVLRGRNCTNTLLTVTRWFGGTLLGTGGLVKAYGNAAKSVIAVADERRAFEELVERIPFSFNTEYVLYEKIRHMMTAYHLCGVTETFAAGIAVSGSIRADEFRQFAAQLCDMSSGRISI